MWFRSPSKLLPILALLCAILASTLSKAQCAVDYVMVKGRVENIPPHSLVRVQLVYAKEQAGESGEVTIEAEAFRIQIPFLTQSRKPVLVGNLLEKCARKPKSVTASLVNGDQEYDRVSLDLAKDFLKSDLSGYTPKTPIVLHGPR